MTRKIILGVLVALVAVLTFVYVKIGPPPTTDTVRVITPPSIIASLPVWVGDTKNMFRKRNLDINFIDLTNSRLMVEAMLAGNADILPAVSLADLASTGGPGNIALMHVMIYSHSRMVKNPPFESILITTGSKMSSLKDLEGKNIAVYPGMTSALAVKHFLYKNNVKTDKITFVKLPPPEHEPALMRDDVQAIHVYEPFRTASLQNLKTREIAGSVYAGLSEPSAIGASAISRNFYRKNQDVAERFLDAWNEAILFIRNQPNEARKILADRLKIPESVAMSATWVDHTATYETDFNILNNTIISSQEAGIIPEIFLLEKDMVLSK